MVNFTLLPLNSSGRYPVPIEWEFGWAPKKVCTVLEKKKILPLPGFEPPTVVTQICDSS